MWSGIKGLYNNIIQLIQHNSINQEQSHQNWSIYSKNVDPELNSFLNNHKWNLIRHHPNITLGLDNEHKLIAYKDKNTKCVAVDKSIIDFQVSDEDLFIHYKCGKVKNFVKELNFKPESIKNLPNPGLLLGLGRVVNMSIGSRHAGFVTNDGCLYVGGNNYYGESGQKPKELYLFSSNYQLDKNNDPSNDVEIVDYKLVMEGVKKVSCGYKHTVCLDKKGNIYSFGDDSKIQLGLGDTRGAPINNIRDPNNDSFAPITTCVPLNQLVTYKPRERHIQYIPRKLDISGDDIATGNDFTVIKSNDMLYACGNNLYGQCGNSLTSQHQMLLPVKLPKGNIKSFSCGNQHCTAQLDDGTVYCWGLSPLQNPHGILHPPKKISLKGHVFSSGDSIITSY